MKGNKYSHIDRAAFGYMANASGRGRGKDRGSFFPLSDAEDMSRGLRFIPGEVTVARRRGEYVEFIHECTHLCCWYWQFPDGSRTYYWERWDYERIAEENGIELQVTEHGSKTGDPGACPKCGNAHTMGGHIKAE